MKAGDVLLFLGLVLIALAIAFPPRQSDALIEDTTSAKVSTAAAISLSAPSKPTAAAAAEPPKPPIAWRLNSVCTIDPLKPNREHQI